MLSAAVEDRHDDVDPVCFAGCSLDDALEILVVIVRGHGIFPAEHLVLAVVISHVYQNEQILAPDGGLDQTLAVSGSKTGALGTDEESIRILLLVYEPAHQVPVDLVTKLRCAFCGDQPQGCYAFL